MDLRRAVKLTVFFGFCSSLALTTTGCSTEPEPPYPGTTFEFEGGYAALGFGFDETGRFFQQRSLVDVGTGTMDGTYRFRDGGTTVASGDVSAAFNLQTGGVLTVVPSKGATGLGRSLLSPPGPVGIDGGLAIGSAALLGGSSVLDGYVHQPTGHVAYVANFESLDYQELQVLLRRPVIEQAYDQNDFTGRWGMATMYRYDGAFYTLIGYADMNATGGLDYYRNTWYDSAAPTTPATNEGTRPDGYWSVDSSGFVTYGPRYRGYVCGNDGAYVWDTIDWTTTPDMSSPAIAVRMDTSGYTRAALEDSYIFAAITATDAGDRVVTGGIIVFDGRRSFQLTGRQNVRGQSPDVAISLAGGYTISAAGELRLSESDGTEIMRGYVGARDVNGRAERAVGAKLTQAGSYGLYFIGR